MLTFAYGSADMQLRFTSHLVRTLAEQQSEIGGGEGANEKLMNKYGEIKKELDDWANDVLCKTMLKTGQIKRIYSEELDHAIDPKDEKFEGIYKAGEYIITLDPLDGSGNIKTRNIFGSILGVYKDNEPKTGRELVASAIVLYGPVFSFIYSTGNGVHELVKNNSNRGFSQFEQMADGRNIKMPKKAALVNPGGNTSWKPESVQVFDELRQIYKIRCAGAAVAEIASLLREGGIFFYPAPKLRLLYEGIPLAFLIEQASGASFDGRSCTLLDTPINSMDQKTPLYVGNEELISKIRVHYGLEPITHETA
jgi:fructose-1,6-bisphosphatase I